MNDELERVFDEALDLLEQGAGIDAIVARYPAQAAELRPFLLTAARLSRLATQPGLSAEAQSKRAFLAAAAAPTASRRPTAVGRFSRLAAGLLALLVVFLLSGSVLVGASASAAPGSALYGTKRLVESARLALATDPERAATLRERFRRERLAEVRQLLAAGRAADVSLTGVIEAIDDYSRGEAHWTVDGLPIVVDEQTAIEGRPAVGALVEIEGRTGGDAVRATRVTVLSAGLPQPTPAPSATPAATLATTPTPAATDDEATTAPGAAPLATATPSPTASPSPAPSPTASPSPFPSPSPAATDDNSNDNGGDDNSNDNGGDDNSNDNGGDDNANDNGGDDNANDNGGDDNANDNGGDDNSNDNGGDDNNNDNGGDDNSNDNGGDDNANDNGGDDNANDNGGDDNNNDNGGDDNANDNGGDDNNNDTGGDDNSGSGGGDNDNGGGNDDEGH